MSRRFPTTLLATPLLLAAFAPAALAGPAAPRPRAAAAVERLKAASNGKAEVRIDPATGSVRSVRLPSSPAGLRPLAPAATAGRRAADLPARMAAARSKSMAFLTSNAGAFGLANPAAQLKAAGETVDAQGGAHFTYQQVYRGVPVFGG